MFIKTARSANDVFVNLASIALDPKVIGYVVRYPSNNKRKQDRYKFVKTSELQNKRVPEKPKAGVVETPIRKPFNPNNVESQSIQKTQAVPKTHVKNVANPKPTYSGIPVGQMNKVNQSFNAPFKRVVGIFNVNKKY
jgi:hypothetical protein